MNYTLSNLPAETYDAVVVGSGVSGGIAIKELTQLGLKTLLVERGPLHEHIESYTHALTPPWELIHRGGLTNELRNKFPNITFEGAYPLNETNEQFWMPFDHSPYIEEKPFKWFRGFGTGGKSLLWGRIALRWSNEDFENNAKEGVGVDWPIRYKDLEPWYAYVERFVGVSGEPLQLPQLPDSIFQPAMPLNCVEADMKSRIAKEYGGSRILTIGRAAHITQATEEQKALGRANCQYRNACSKGCPYGAYYSTNAAALPAARQTKNLSVLSNGIVQQVLLDTNTNKASGILVMDAHTKEVKEIKAKLVFLNASTIGTTHILLNSKSARFPNGLGNTNDMLGRNLMDHHSRVKVFGEIEGFENQYYYGNRANGFLIPHYRNVGKDKRPYLRSFDWQGQASRGRGEETQASFGKDFKKAASSLGIWNVGMHAFGECLPYEENRMYLHASEKDRFGMPKIVFDAEFKENEMKMREEIVQDGAEILEKCGVKNVRTSKLEKPPMGLSKHEMGTARMGRDSKTSILNAHNQIWDCKNVFVTDGAAMTSSNCVNPSLTYMALTARAAHFAVQELKSKNL